MTDLSFATPQLGVVVDNVDPQGLHRVRARVPGLIEPMSAWAFPLTAGGGSAARGGHVVPAVGASVVLQFIGGDPEFPIYTAAWWGLPAAGSEVPGVAREAGADAHLVSVLQVGRLRLTVDERPRAGDVGQLVAIEDVQTGDGITLDLENIGITIKASSELHLKADGVVNIEGAQVVLNGRVLQPMAKGIC